MKKYTTPWTNQKMNPMDVQHRIECYVGMVQQKMNDYWELADYDHDEPPIIYAEYGKKYARIVHSAANRSSRSVHTFVNMINGDILKAGGWKAPATNGVRGNVFDNDFGASVVNQHGAIYLKGSAG